MKLNLAILKPEVRPILRSLTGADPGLILGCCKILQKKLNIEMM